MAVNSIVPAPSTRTSPVSRWASLKLRNEASALVAEMDFSMEIRNSWLRWAGPVTFRVKTPDSTSLDSTDAPVAPVISNPVGTSI